MLNKNPIYTSIPATDIDRATAFYTDKLGFTVKQTRGDGSVTFECANGTGFFIYPTQFAGTAQHTIAGWMVDDIEAEISALRGNGVTFEEYDMPGLKTVDGIAVLGDERSAWFKDSEGNILAIFQPAHALV